MNTETSLCWRGTAVKNNARSIPKGPSIYLTLQSRHRALDSSVVTSSPCGHWSLIRNVVGASSVSRVPSVMNTSSTHSAHLIDCIFASHCFSVDGRNSVKWHKSHDTSHVSKFGRQLVHGKAKRISNASKNPLTIPFSGFLLKAHTFLALDVKNSSPLLGPPIPCSWYFTYSPSRFATAGFSQTMHRMMPCLENPFFCIPFRHPLTT